MQAETVEVCGVDGRADKLLAIESVSAIVSVLKLAVREDDGERYVALVNTAHDLGRCILGELRGQDAAPTARRVFECSGLAFE